MNAKCTCLPSIWNPCLLIWPVTTSLPVHTNHVLMSWNCSFCGLTWREVGRHAQWLLWLLQSGQLSQGVWRSRQTALSKPGTVRKPENTLTPTHRSFKRNLKIQSPAKPETRFIFRWRKRTEHVDLGDIITSNCEMWCHCWVWQLISHYSHIQAFIPLVRNCFPEALLPFIISVAESSWLCMFRPTVYSNV